MRAARLKRVRAHTKAQQVGGYEVAKEASDKLDRNEI